MGYYSEYSLEVLNTPDPTAVIQQLRKECEWAEGGLNDNGSSRERMTWYDHEDDLRTFSKKHPQLVFKLTGYGEGRGDDWDKYFQDGKMQACRAVVTKPPFDPSKLE